MTLGFWDKLTGVREHPAFCPRCGRDVQPCMGVISEYEKELKKGGEKKVAKEGSR